MASTISLYGTEGGDTLDVTNITSGTSSTITENGLDRLIKVNHPTGTDDYWLTIPRPSDVPAGRKIQFWVDELYGWYFSVQTSSASDLFELSSERYNGNDPERYMQTYSAPGPILTLVSDGILSWYSDSASYSGAWYATEYGP